MLVQSMPGKNGVLLCKDEAYGNRQQLHGTIFAESLVKVRQRSPDF